MKGLHKEGKNKTQENFRKIQSIIMRQKNFCGSI